MAYLQGRAASPQMHRTGRHGRRPEDWDALYPLPSAEYETLVKELASANSLDSLLAQLTKSTKEDVQQSIDTTVADSSESLIDNVNDPVHTTVITDNEQTDTLYHQHYHWLKRGVNQCDTLLKSLLALNKELEYLSTSEQHIRQTTTSLSTISEKLLDKQSHLVSLEDAIAVQLDYFDRLSHLVRLIDPANATGMMPLPPTSPGWSPITPTQLDVMIDADSQDVDVDETEATRFVCLRSDFLPILDAMEQSIEFLSMKTNYREAAAYLEKFIECRGKAGQLIRQHVSEAWMSMAREIARKLEAKTPSERQSESALLPLLYVKFRATTPEIRPLLEKLEQLALNDVSCLKALEACQMEYLDIRQRLLGPLTEERLSIMDQPNMTLVEMALDSLTFVTTMGAEERALYHVFFTNNNKNLSINLGRLIQMAYERLRPRILQETDPSVLEELCAVVRAHLPEELDLNEDRERTLEERALLDADVQALQAILQVAQRKLDNPNNTDLDSCAIM